MEAQATAPTRASTKGLPGLLERLHLTIAGIAVLALASVGWLLARVVGARALYMMVYGSFITVGLAYAIARSRIAVDASRTGLSSRAIVGQTIDIDLHITGKRGASGFLLTEEMPERLASTITIPVASLATGEELTYQYTIAPTLRGVYEVGPLVGRWSDPFGLTNHSRVFCEPEELIVHPRTEHVDDRVVKRMWEDPPVRPPASKPWPVGFEFYGMRDYEPGDDLRRVVWAAVARTGRLLVRESEQGITDRVVVVVDITAESHSRGVVSETFETAIELAASVGTKHLKDGFALSLVTNDGVLLRRVRGSGGRIRFLDELARLQLSERPLVEAVRELTLLARDVPHALLATPALDLASAAQLKVAIDKGANVVCAHIQWEEADPLTLQRATAVGCQEVEVPAGAPLSSIFAVTRSGRR